MAISLTHICVLVEKLREIDAKTHDGVAAAELLQIEEQLTDIINTHRKIFRSCLEKKKMDIPGYVLKTVRSNGDFKDLAGMVDVLCEKAGSCYRDLIERKALTGSAARMREEWDRAVDKCPDAMRDASITEFMTPPEFSTRLCKDKRHNANSNA